MATKKLSKTEKKQLWKNWLVVEKKIREEMGWLRNTVQLFIRKERVMPAGCQECFLRKLALLIVSGQVEATEITKSPILKSFWAKRGRNKNRKKIHHGGDWHQETMEIIENHLLSLGFEVTREPNLSQGRADFSVFKNGVPNLHVEMGTITSFYKILLNLKAMKNFIYLIVLDDSRLIEFRVQSLRSPTPKHKLRLCCPTPPTCPEPVEWIPQRQNFQ